MSWDTCVRLRMLYLTISLLLPSVEIAYGFGTIAATTKISTHRASRTSSKTTPACFMIQSNPFRDILDKLPPVPSFPALSIGGSPTESMSPFRGVLDKLPAVPSFLTAGPTESIDRFCKARELVNFLVKEEKCFSTESGAIAFGNACASDCVFEDCYEPISFVGKEVSARPKGGFYNIDVLGGHLPAYSVFIQRTLTTRKI
jgi:hypothetical protein